MFSLTSNDTEVQEGQPDVPADVIISETDNMDIPEDVPYHEDTTEDIDFVPSRQLEVELPTKLEVANKEEKLRTSEYMERVVNGKELDLASQLNNAFRTHLEKNYKIEIVESIRSTVPTGIDSLDTILGGGFGTGVIQVVGNPGSGKSALVAKVIATGQRKYPGKFNAVYVDSEDSTTEERLANLGVIYPRISPINSMSVEKVFQIIEGMCTYKTQNPEFLNIPWVIVWDSIANTMTEAGMQAESANSVIGERARALAHYLPKYVPKLNKFNISLVCVNQLRDKIEMGIFKTPADLRYLANSNIPGGKSLIFNSLQIIYVRPTSDMKGEYGFNGTLVEGKMIKNKLFSPNIPFKLVFSFEKGFSNFWTNFQLLKDSKRIQAGAWCKIKSCPEAGTFRQNQALEFYRNKPDFRTAFDNDVKEVLEEEYIKKYTSTKDSNVEI